MQNQTPAIVAPPASAIAGLTRQDRERVADAVQPQKASQGKSPETERAYRSAWSAWSGWQEWAEARGAVAIPAAPEAVAAYLAERAETTSMATVRLASAAIAYVHKLRREP